MSDDAPLGTYLNDHLAAATAAVELFSRVTRTGPDKDTIAALADLADEVSADRDTLRQLMRRLAVEEKRPMEALGWLGEKVGRLKPNGSLLHRSPLTDVVELEGLLLCVSSKLGCWRALRALADHDPRVATQEMEILVRRAERQASRLEQLHGQAVQRRLAASPTR